MAAAKPVRMVPNRKSAAQRLTCIPGRIQVRQSRSIVTLILAQMRPTGFDAKIRGLPVNSDNPGTIARVPESRRYYPLKLAQNEIRCDAKHECELWRF